MDVMNPNDQLAFSLFNNKMIPQRIAALGVVFLLAQFGSMYGWTSPYSTRLTAPDSPIPLTLSQMSWVTSLLNLGRIVGSLISGVCIYLLGSKKAIIYSLVPIIIGWLLISIADRPWLLYVARLSGGVGLGMVFNCFPLFIGEIASPEIRGAIVTVSCCGASFGFLVANILGIYLSLANFALIFLVLGLTNVGILLYLPETPYHLLKLDRPESAKRSLQWYRGGADVTEEMDAVQSYMSSVKLETFRQKLQEFGKPHIRKACMIAATLYAFMQVCGFNSVMMYAEMIFKKGGSDLIPPSNGTVLVSFLGTVTLVVSINVMDKFGRRAVTVVSALGSALAMAALGTHFLLMDYGLDTSGFRWLPLASIVLFNEAYVVGLMIVPSVVMSEIFPSNIKSIAACFIGFIASVFAFGSSKTYQPMVNALGEAYVFYIYAAIDALCIPFVLFVMPETKGKSLQQIQRDLMTVEKTNNKLIVDISVWNRDELACNDQELPIL